MAPQADMLVLWQVAEDTKPVEPDDPKPEEQKTETCEPGEESEHGYQDRRVPHERILLSSPPLLLRCADYVLGAAVVSSLMTDPLSLAFPRV